MNPSNSDHTTDRWGHEDVQPRSVERDDDSSWLMWILILLLLIVVGGGGVFMTMRLRQTQAMAEAERARAEAMMQADRARAAADNAARGIQEKIEAERKLAASNEDRGLEDLVPLLTKHLKSQSPQTRELAARFLGELGRHGNDVIPELKKLLDDPDANVRKAATEAIERIQKDIGTKE